jgi:hypothetical protein
MDSPSSPTEQQLASEGEPCPHSRWKTEEAFNNYAGEWILTACRRRGEISSETTAAGLKKNAASPMSQMALKITFGGNMLKMNTVVKKQEKKMMVRTKVRMKTLSKNLHLQ